MAADVPVAVRDPEVEAVGVPEIMVQKRLKVDFMYYLGTEKIKLSLKFSAL